MNISHEHKVIWWAPERCGTKATAHIFSKLGFEYFKTSEEKEKTINDDGINYQSHNIDVPDIYKDYQIICSIRNPYDRMLSVFSNFTSVGKSLVYTKNSHDKLVITYENFIREMLLYRISRSDEDLETRPIQRNYLSKYHFEKLIPNFFIKMESLEDDLGKLDFVKDSNIWKSGYIQDYLKHNPQINQKPYKFNDVYTIESAKRVYDYHKKHFMLCDYDPFSFTTKELSNEEKMRFIHDIL